MHVLLLLIAFLESFATTAMERGIYFFTRDQMSFRESTNLWLAFAFGVMYVVGALSSHGLTKRLRERPVLMATICLQFIMHLILSVPTGWTLFACFIALGFLNGVKWPVIESFVSAGKSPSEQAGSVGRFNVSWALAVPLALAAVGPLKAWWQPSLFLVPATINLTCLLLCLRLRVSPQHMAADDAQRPGAERLARLDALLVADRWLMLLTYTLLFLLAPLLPNILAPLVAQEIKPALSGLIDVFRLGAFFLLGGWIGWHGRVWPIVVCLVATPVGVFLILFGSNLPAVIAGEIVFGLSAGVVYYGALYYAMVVKNASVEGGGAHEGLIGSGFALGPALGLIAIALQPVLGGNNITATVLVLGPVMVLCSLAACRPLWRARRMLSEKQ
jgi:MFS family permease